MNCGLLLTSGDRFLLTDADALTLTSVCDGSTPVLDEQRFGGAPVSIRDIDKATWERQLKRLLREDEELLLCL